MSEMTMTTNKGDIVFEMFDEDAPKTVGNMRDLAEKGWAPVRYWLIWWTALGVAMVLFYVVLTPIWLGLRAAAWVAELRSRLR